MKHRSVSKVRSTKLAKKTRFVARQESNAIRGKKLPTTLVWRGNTFIKGSTDPETGIFLKDVMIRGNGTYSRAKHDIHTRDSNGVIVSTKRYIAS